MFRRFSALLAVVAAVAATSPCILPSAPAADTITLQAAKDNTLFESATGSLSNGSGDGMFAGTIMGGQRRRALIAFVIAGHIPDGAAIQSVQLILSMSRTSVGSRSVRLHRVLAEWGEGTSDAGGGGGGQGAAATTNDATWIHTFFNGSLWSNPGGDFVASPSAEIQVAGLGSYTWGSTQGMIADVQAWLDGRGSNFGWILVGDELGTPPSTKRFDTHEHPVAANRPQLVVEFTGSAVAAGTWSGIKHLYR